MALERVTVLPLLFALTLAVSLAGADGLAGESPLDELEAESGVTAPVELDGKVLVRARDAWRSISSCGPNRSASACWTPFWSRWGSWVGR